MKKLVFLLLLSVFIGLTGCVSQPTEDSTKESEEMPQKLEAAIQLPESINPNDEVTVGVLVTQGEENVEDASEVKFELWKSGEDNHEMITAKHQDNGVYAVTTSFSEDGTYFLVAHVTARDFHTMPKKEFIVGKPNQDKDDGNNEPAPTKATESHSHEHSNLLIDLEFNEDIKVNEEVTLTAEVENEGEPLAEAVVRFEIWQEHEEKHIYINATEEVQGEYKSTYTFNNVGTYNVQVHVNKGKEIHEHIMKTISVN